MSQLQQMFEQIASASKTSCYGAKAQGASSGESELVEKYARANHRDVQANPDGRLATQAKEHVGSTIAGGVFPLHHVS